MRARALGTLPLTVLCLTLAALPVAPLATAAEAAAGPLVEDPAGDVRVVAGGASNPAPGQAYAGVDLRALTVAEDLEMLHFAVKFTDLKAGQDDAGDDGLAMYVQFAHAGRAFLIVGYHGYYGPLGEFTGASLSYRDSDGADWSQQWFRGDVATYDAAADTFTVSVPRGDLADPFGAAPFPGRRLEGFAASANNALGDRDFICCPLGLSVPSPASFADAMPDAGPAPQGYEVRLGLRQSGHALLTSPEPFRASNGEATTFLFKAVAKNTGAARDAFALRAASVPQGWSVVLPVPSLALDGGATQEVTALVTVPFTHVHGSVQSFVLEMPSDTDPASVGRVELGVRYLAIPQPAGHHNTLFFHAYAYNEFSQAIAPVFSGNDGYPFMNAVEQMDGDAAIPLTPSNMDTQAGTGGSPSTAFQWCVLLNPGLQMGLDFVLDGLGKLSVPLHAAAPLNGATLEARLLLVPPELPNKGPYSCYSNRDPVVLAEVQPTPPVDVAANTDAVLQGDVRVLPAADRLPYRKAQNVELFVTVRGLSAPNFFTGATAPTLLPGATLMLPLVEYHDEVQQVLATAAGPDVSALGPQERRANPGATVLFPFSLANERDAERTIRLNVTGVNAGWAQAVPDVAVPAHGTARAEVVVRVPADAAAGDAADLVLQAFDPAQPAERTLVRLLVVADTSSTLPDDAALVTPLEEKGSPSLAAAGLLSVLAAAGLLSRRRLA